jgi:hypothetical protein
MATPKDVALILSKKKQRQRDAEEVEHSINAHFAYDKECDHHCTDCCSGLYLEDSV